jgi:hypothetical protein
MSHGLKTSNELVSHVGKKTHETAICAIYVLASSIQFTTAAAAESVCATLALITGQTFTMAGFAALVTKSFE